MVSLCDQKKISHTHTQPFSTVDESVLRPCSHFQKQACVAAPTFSLLRPACGNTVDGRWDSESKSKNKSKAQRALSAPNACSGEFSYIQNIKETTKRRH